MHHDGTLHEGVILGDDISGTAFTVWSGSGVGVCAFLAIARGTMESVCSLNQSIIVAQNPSRACSGECFYMEPTQQLWAGFGAMPFVAEGGGGIISSLATVHDAPNAEWFSQCL